MGVIVSSCCEYKNSSKQEIEIVNTKANTLEKNITESALSRNSFSKESSSNQLQFQ